MGGELVTSTGHDRSVHLVLSAGGVKCLSYAGAVAALSEHGISFATVSGCSAGSLIGALLCSDDQRPILVLRPKRDVARPLPSSTLEYLTRVIELGGGSFDSYLIQEMPRAHLVEIDCGAIKFDRFDVPVEARNRLVASGRVAVEGRLKELRGLMRSLPPPPIARDEPATARVGAEAMKKLFDALPPWRDQVFISYSHDDAEWLHRFQETLKPYTETKPIRIWTDTAIRPGARWREEIEAALGAAKVAVLLVTISYLASDFVRDVELQKFIEASREHGLRLMPVAVGASMYEESPLRDYQFVNTPERPLADMDRAEQDREIVRICKEIKKALEGSEVGP